MKMTRDPRSKIIQMTKALIVPNVTVEDRGTYVCIASIEDNRLQLSTKVTVYGEDVMLCHYLNTLMLL